MNKFKGISDSIKLRYLMFIFGASVLVLLPTRVFQLLAVVDPATGFFTKQDITVTIMAILLFVFTALFICLSFVSREVPSPELPVGKNRLLGITSVIALAGFAYDIIAIESRIVPSAQSSRQIFMSLLKSNIVDNGGVLVVLQFAFALLAVIYFAIFAASHLNGKGSYKEYRILALSPLCWATVRLVSRLLTAISFVRVSELLYEIFACVFLMLFFLTFARISSGVFSEDSMWGIYGYGFCAAMFLSLVTVPRLAMIVVGQKAVAGNEFNFADLTSLVFVLSYIFASLGVGFKGGVAERKSTDGVELLPEETEGKAFDAAPSEKAEETAEDNAEDLSDESETAAGIEFTDVEAPEDDADDEASPELGEADVSEDAASDEEEPSSDKKSNKIYEKLRKKERKQTKKKDDASESEISEDDGDGDADDDDDDDAPLSSISLAELKKKNND